MEVVPRKRRPYSTLEKIEMKKTLVAIAALAAIGAQAQTAVSIIGYFDRGYVMTNNTNDAKDAKAIGSNAGTTAIKFQLIEDLGAGMKARFLSETNPSDGGGTAQDTTAVDVTGNQSGFNNGESFFELSGGFGSLRLGSPNNEIGTAVTGVASPALSTGVGSAYSSSWSGFNGVGTGVTGTGNIIAGGAIVTSGVGVRGIRQANTIKYISNNINGITVAYGMAPKNNTGTGDTVGVVDYSARYQNGPLDIMYAAIRYDTNTTATANTSVATGISAAGANYTGTMLGISYEVMPGLKLHGGSGSSKSGTDAYVNATNKQFGATYKTGAWTIMAQTATMDDRGTSGFDRKMTGFGTDYNLTKNTRAYFRYDNLNYNSSGTAASGSQVKRSAFGLSTAF